MRRVLLGLCLLASIKAFSSYRITEFEDEFKHSSRSCVVYFENNSTGRLTLSKSWFSHQDCFTDTLPPNAIEAGESVVWASESGGMGRAKGSAFYLCSHCDSEVVIKWNIPFIGKNSYKFRSGGGHTTTITELVNKNNAIVKFLFGSPPSA